MSCTEYYFALSTLLCSVAALVVAYISLRISKQVAELNSHNFAPRFTIDFLPDGITIKNKDYNLYDIRMVTIVAIQHTGYFAENSSASVDIPLILHSRRFGDLNDFDSILKPNNILRNRWELQYKDGEREMQPYETSTKIIQEIESIMQDEFGLDSKMKKGYASPVMRYLEYYISIDYRTKNFETKQYGLYRRGAGRGAGEQRIQITTTEFEQKIANYITPSFASAREFIKYCRKNRRIE